MKYLLPAIFIILLISLSPDRSTAQVTEERVAHTVEIRETLFSIARRYQITVQDIRDWNNLESDVLPPGTVIYVSPPLPERAPEPQPQAPLPVTDPLPEIRVQDNHYHEVLAGETLFSIARRYQLTVAEIRDWNDADLEILRPGMMVRIAPPDATLPVEPVPALPDTPVRAEPAIPQPPTEPVTERKITPKIHEVEVGENLFSISRKYDVHVNQIREWNSLEVSAIQPGQKLTVGYDTTYTSIVTVDTGGIDVALEMPEAITPVREEPVRVSPEPEPQLEPEAATEKQITPKTHQVKQGETLFSVSRQYNVHVNQIRAWNNLQVDALRVGQNLTVGYDTTFVAAAPREVRPTGERPAVTGTPGRPDREPFRLEDQTTEVEFYSVRPGDTLSSISRRFGTTLADLRYWNNLRSDHLAVGQQLIIGMKQTAPRIAGLSVESTAQGRFYEYEFQRTDNIFRILINHQMDEVDFRALNSNLNPTDVRAGMNIVLLAPPTTRHQNPYLVRRGQEGGSESLVYATVYSDAEMGQSTTGGDLYNPDHLTAAHISLPLGSVVHVQNPDNGRGIFVLINDRTTDSRIKLSRKAFQALQLDRSTSPQVRVQSQPN